MQAPARCVRPCSLGMPNILSLREIWMMSYCTHWAGRVDSTVDDVNHGIAQRLYLVGIRLNG